MVAQTNHQITKYVAKIKLTRWFVFEWGKPTRQKLYWVILRSQLSRIHYYHNKLLQVKEFQYFIPTYNWTFTLIPNWTCFVMTIYPFQCMAPSTWLTNWADPSTRLDHQLEKDVGCKVLQFITRWRSRSCLVTKPYSVQTQQFLQERDELGQILFLVTICMNQTLLHTCATCVTFDGS